MNIQRWLIFQGRCKFIPSILIHGRSESPPINWLMLAFEGAYKVMYILYMMLSALVFRCNVIRRMICFYNWI